jgi:hypothetical protein
VLALAAAVAVLQSLPFLLTRFTRPDPGRAWLGVPYIPQDWLAYLALVRQDPRAGELFLSNPFTTDPQDGRFILLLHQLLNFVRRLTGADPGWLLELARAALILVFAVVLWRFLAELINSERTRAWAMTLVFASGGFSFVALWWAQGQASALSNTVSQHLWPMYGWTTFEACYNPLWVAGLVLLLVAIRPLLRPGGPRSARELALSGGSLLLLWFTHPYSAIAAVAIAGVAAAGEWLIAGRFERRRAARIALAVLPPLALASLVTLWQLADPVYARTSGGVLGDQDLGVFWYPVAFGLVGVLAVVGWALWIHERHPWRFALGGWIVAIALLHTSPLLNGYHFVPYAFLPLAILAARPVERIFERGRGGAPPARAWAMAAAVLLFANPAWLVMSAAYEVREYQVPQDVHAALVALGAMPPGNVLADTRLGNLVPAFGSHRVYVGQWFMTPDYQARSDRVRRAFQPDSLRLLRELVAQERIDYLLAPTTVAFPAATALRDLSPSVAQHGGLTLVRLNRR